MKRFPPFESSNSIVPPFNITLVLLKFKSDITVIKPVPASALNS